MRLVDAPIVEKMAFTARELSVMTGYSEDYIRAACHRSKENHQLPHVKCGEIRPIIRVRYEVFLQWLKEEEAA